MKNYVSYLLKAEAQLELLRKDEANNTLQEGINKLESSISENNINYLQEIESKATLYLLKESLRTMNFRRYELHKI